MVLIRRVPFRLDSCGQFRSAGPLDPAFLSHRRRSAAGEECVSSHGTFFLRRRRRHVVVSMLRTSSIAVSNNDVRSIRCTCRTPWTRGSEGRSESDPLVVPTRDFHLHETSRRGGSVAARLRQSVRAFARLERNEASSVRGPSRSVAPTFVHREWIRRDVVHAWSCSS